MGHARGPTCGIVRTRLVLEFDNRVGRLWSFFRGLAERGRSR